LVFFMMKDDWRYRLPICEHTWGILSKTSLGSTRVLQVLDNHITESVMVGWDSK
jgi:hypothetical protein